ncbi:hypothetical protein HK405_011390, partial [Cladochytrium tenue]
ADGQKMTSMLPGLPMHTLHGALNGDNDDHAAAGARRNSRKGRKKTTPPTRPGGAGVAETAKPLRKNRQSSTSSAAADSDSSRELDTPTTSAATVTTRGAVAAGTKHGFTETATASTHPSSTQKRGRGSRPKIPPLESPERESDTIERSPTDRSVPISMMTHDSPGPDSSAGSSLSAAAAAGAAQKYGSLGAAGINLGHKLVSAIPGLNGAGSAILSNVFGLQLDKLVDPAGTVEEEDEARRDDAEERSKAPNKAPVSSTGMRGRRDSEEGMPSRRLREKRAAEETPARAAVRAAIASAAASAGAERAARRARAGAADTGTKTGLLVDVDVGRAAGGAHTSLATRVAAVADLAARWVLRFAAPAVKRVRASPALSSAARWAVLLALMPVLVPLLLVTWPAVLAFWLLPERDGSVKVRVRDTAKSWAAGAARYVEQAVEPELAAAKPGEAVGATVAANGTA